jgi:hypothetical protein
MKENLTAVALSIMITGAVTLVGLGCYSLGQQSVQVDPTEYQITVTDDSITVKDFGKTVGTVKLTGELQQLIYNDNK